MADQVLCQQKAWPIRSYTRERGSKGLMKALLNGVDPEIRVTLFKRQSKGTFEWV
jgi:hypothetical protein